MKKAIVIADDEHKSLGFFDLFFESVDVHLDYICDVSEGPGKPNPLNVMRFLKQNPGRYCAAVVCGCCSDSFDVVSDKDIFPGKVIFFNYGDTHGYPVEEIKRKADLYFFGSHTLSQVKPHLKKLFS